MNKYSNCYFSGSRNKTNWMKLLSVSSCLECPTNKHRVGIHVKANTGY